MSRNTTHPDANATDHERLDDLLRKLVDGVITRDEHAALESLLVDDTNARRRYQEYVSLHALLHWDHAGVAGRPIALEPPRAVEVGGEQRRDTVEASEDRHQDERAVVARINLWRRAAVAAVLLIGVGLVIALTADGLNSGDELAADQATSAFGPGVAMLTVVNDATWGDDSIVHDATDFSMPIPDGPIHMASGSAQLVLASGAAVTLQGPTQMQITGPNRTMLTRGRLTVQVPPNAHGMTVDAPGGVSVVDLGTRFSIEVDEWGRVEVYGDRG